MADAVADADLAREIGAYLRGGASWDELTDKSVRLHLEATLLPGHEKNVLKPRKKFISEAVEAARQEILAERAKAEAGAAEAGAAEAGAAAVPEPAGGGEAADAAAEDGGAEPAAGLRHGAVVWGKYLTYPHWPAMIMPVPATGEYKKLKPQLEKLGAHFVRFFGTNDHAVCQVRRLRPSSSSPRPSSVALTRGVPGGDRVGRGSGARDGGEEDDRERQQEAAAGV